MAKEAQSCEGDLIPLRDFEAAKLQPKTQKKTSLCFLCYTAFQMAKSVSIQFFDKFVRINMQK